MGGERPVEGQTRGWFGRFAKLGWYVGASILLLSLPTFSFLTPDDSALTPRKLLSAGFRLVNPEPAAEPSLTDFPSRGDYEAEGAVRRNSTRARRSKEGQMDEDADGSPWVVSERRRPYGSGVTDRLPEGTQKGRSDRSDRGRNPGQGEPPVAGRGQVPGNLAPDALADLDQAYQSASNGLFNGNPGFSRRRGNPFQNAVGDGADTGNGDGNSDSGTGGSEGSDGDSSDVGDDGGEGDDGGSDSGDNDTGDDSNGGQDDLDTAPKSFRFLVIGPFGADPSVTGVFRGRREVQGSFLLDNARTVSLPFGVVGGGRIPVFVEPNESLSASDFNGDGLQDFLLTQATLAGTFWQSFVQNPQLGFVPVTSGSIAWRAISSLSLFDFNEDSVDDLAVLPRGPRGPEDRLMIYSLFEGQWIYEREMVLPEPMGITVASNLGAGFLSQILYILTPDLTSGVGIHSRQPDRFRPNATLALRTLKSFYLDIDGDGVEETELAVMDLRDRILVMSREGGSYHRLAELNLSGGTQTLVVGDFSGDGKLRLLWVP